MRLSRERFLTLLAAVFVIAFSFSLYWPALHSGLVSDDWDLSVPGTHPWNSFLGHWFGGGTGTFYRPLSRLLVYYEARLFGYDGFAQHLISQLLMLATVAVTSAMVWRATGFLGALVTALLLVSSPTIASTTSWVSSQTDLLCALFLALAIYPIAKNPMTVSYRDMTLSFVFGFLSYLSKDSAAILGPLGLVYLALLVYYPGIKDWRKMRPAIMLGALHFVFLLLYLGFRVWRLGEMSPGSSESYIPLHGKVWHYNQAYLTGLRELLFPFIDLYKPINAGDIQAVGSLWPALLTGLAICVLLIMRKRAATFALVAFVVAYIPFITAPFESNPAIGMSEIRRYAYNPIYFLASFVGLLFPRNRDSTNGVSPWIALILLIAFLQASIAQQRIVDYSKAGQFRDRLFAEQSKVTDSGKIPVTFYVSGLPDKFGDAYVFRNGFESMTKINYPSSKVIDTRGKSATPQTSASGVAYSINVDDKNAVIMQPMENIWKVRDEVRSSGTAAEPMVFDPSNSTVTLSGLAPGNLTITPEKDGLTLTLEGNDPVIILPPLKSNPYYLYKQVTLKVDFIDAKEPHKTDIMQFLWALKSDSNPASYPYINAEVLLRPGTQTVTFDLDQNVAWFRPGTLSFARIDFPELYTGRVKVTYIGVK